MENMIPVKHHVEDYECMWNGIEDLYMEKTGEVLPDMAFFMLAGGGNFIYMRTPGSAVKCRAVWNDGRTGKMYERLSPLIGMHYKHTQGTRFQFMMKRAKAEIDKGCPVVLGCLDMYYLEYYPKFFGKMHIPIHYVLMTGYSDEKQCAYILDCGVAGVQTMSYQLLEQALDIQKTGLSDKNGLYTLRFDQKLPSLQEIAVGALRSKAENMLHPPVRTLGIPGMKRLAKEFGSWQQELSYHDFRAVLEDLVVFTGTVPNLPDQLLPEDVKSGILHMAGREKWSGVLRDFAERFDIPQWNMAAEEYGRSGKLLSGMTDHICDFLLGNTDDLSEISQMIADMALIEERAFRFMLEGADH